METFAGCEDPSTVERSGSLPRRKGDNKLDSAFFISVHQCRDDMQK